MINLKKIIASFLLFVFLNMKAYAEVVNKVEVKGNQRVTLETIVIFGDIIIGNNYETSDINSLIKKLYQTNFFKNISVDLINGKLTITVEENPVIKSIIFKGEKAVKYKETIKELLTLRENTSFLESFVKSDINIVKEVYRSLGFYFVKIDLDLEKLDKNRVNLVYTIFQSP